MSIESVGSENWQSQETVNSCESRRFCVVCKTRIKPRQCVGVVTSFLLHGASQNDVSSRQMSSPSFGSILFIVNRQRLESIAVDWHGGHSSSAVNWNESDRQRDYADATGQTPWRISIHETSTSYWTTSNAPLSVCPSVGRPVRTVTVSASRRRRNARPRRQAKSSSISIPIRTDDETNASRDVPS